MLCARAVVEDADEADEDDMSRASLWMGSRLRSLRQALLGLRCRLVAFGRSSAIRENRGFFVKKLDFKVNEVI